MRANKKRLKYKLKQREIELARKPEVAAVTLGSPVDSDEEYEGQENYEESNTENSEQLPIQNSKDSHPRHATEKRKPPRRYSLPNKRQKR